MGGPTIPWKYGRVDAVDSSSVPPEGRLPSADSGTAGADADDVDHLRTIFNRMGFNDQEIVALSGAHSLGRCHRYVELFFSYCTDVHYIPVFVCDTYIYYFSSYFLLFGDNNFDLLLQCMPIYSTHFCSVTGVDTKVHGLQHQQRFPMDFLED